VIPASARDAVYDWSGWSQDLPDPATWADHFKKYARVQLGKEQRLPNGVAWRLLTDTGTGISMPRLTWMPDARSVRTANDMLDKVHGAEMLMDEAEWRSLQDVNEYRRREGIPPLRFRHAIVQDDVRLTYASKRLVSLVELALLQSEGNHWPAIMRGLTLDLERAEIFHVETCPDTIQVYGSRLRPGEGNYRFRYGELLNLCEQESYRKFIALVKAHAPPPARPNAFFIRECPENLDHPHIAEDQEYILYLTFQGLAVQAASWICPIRGAPPNVVIVPYQDLEPFMQPGPWRDELLKLR
jgi:hypothetical protein